MKRQNYILKKGDTTMQALSNQKQFQINGLKLLKELKVIVSHDDFDNPFIKTKGILDNSSTKE